MPYMQSQTYTAFFPKSMETNLIDLIIGCTTFALTEVCNVPQAVIG